MHAQLQVEDNKSLEQIIRGSRAPIIMHRTGNSLYNSRSQKEEEKDLCG